MTITIEIYADVVSERGYLAKRQLQQGAERLDSLPGGGVELIWRPVLIDPTAPARSINLTERSAAGPDAAGSGATPNLIEGEASIQEVDIASLVAGPAPGPRFGTRWRASSWAAHRMITAALEHGPAVQNEVVDVLMTAHFVDGTDINDAAFLQAIATRFDLPAPVVAEGSSFALAYLEPGFAPDDKLERATREAQLFGQALGVSVSPTLVINGQIVLADSGPWPAKLLDALTDLVADAAAHGATATPPEVRRFRAARALLDARNPNGCLYLLEPLRSEYEGERDFEMLTAQALAASASLRPARAKFAKLLDVYPDDAYLHLMMGRTLERMQDPGADRHLALAAAMDPRYAD